MRLPPARATAGIVIASVLAFAVAALFQVNSDVALAGGFIPTRFDGARVSAVIGAQTHGLPLVPLWLTPLSATLVHGGFMHIFFNMLMLAFCGRFVEAAIGSPALLLLYVVGAYAAAAGQYAWDPHSFVPMVGASGAASAIMGAYALLYGQRRATFTDARLNLLINVAWLAAAWIGVQLLLGIASSHGGAAIAIYAHIGGFLAGLILARPLLLWRYRTA